MGHRRRGTGGSHRPSASRYPSATNAEPSGASAMAWTCTGKSVISRMAFVGVGLSRS